MTINTILINTTYHIFKIKLSTNLGSILNRTKYKYIIKGKDNNNNDVNNILLGMNTIYLINTTNTTTIKIQLYKIHKVIISKKYNNISSDKLWEVEG